MTDAKLLSFVECNGPYSQPFPIINYTPSQWTLGYTHSYQMDNWNWPKTVPAGTSYQMCVQPGESGDTQDDAGEATYTIDDTSDSFQLQYRSDNGMQVLYTSLQTRDVANGSTVMDTASFILAGQHGNYISNSVNGNNWMQAYYDVIGGRECIPGSHDAGMSTLGNPGPFSNVYNTRTQTYGIRGQLELGSRWFDIRPCIKGSSYTTCHITPISTEPGYVGGTGQNLADIVSDINAFTAVQNELIFLELSHGYNLNNQPASGFTDDEWYGAFKILAGLNHRFTAGSSTTLDQLKVSDYIGKKSSAVVMIVEGPTDLDVYAGQGFYVQNSKWPYYTSYADSDSVEAVADDQDAKMKQIRTSQDSEEFLLSWTLTQTEGDAAGAGPGGRDGLPEYSIVANNYFIWPGMFQVMNGNTSQKVYPNIILTDASGCWMSSANADSCRNNTDVVSLSLALSYQGLPFC